MSRSAQRLLLSTVVIPAATLLAACGGGGTSHTTGSASGSSSTRKAQSSSPGEVVAQVGSVPVTKAQINHWMFALGGTAYHFVSHAMTAPEGLVSDPPDYGRCVTTLESEASKWPLGRARETSSELLTKCHELNTALKIEATNYLISTQQDIQLAGQEGVAVTPTQVQSYFQRTRADREYATEAGLHEYLTSRRMTLPDLLLELKLELIGQGLLKKINVASPEVRAAYTALRQQWVTKTSCQPGYVVEGCGQYKGGATYPSTPPPSALMEQVFAVITDKCADLKGCGKQVGQ